MFNLKWSKKWSFGRIWKKNATQIIFLPLKLWGRKIIIGRAQGTHQPEISGIDRGFYFFNDDKLDSLILCEKSRVSNNLFGRGFRLFLCRVSGKVRGFQFWRAVSNRRAFRNCEDTSRTRHPLSTGIFSAKNVTHQSGFEPTTSCLPGRRTTNCAMVTK